MNQIKLLDVKIDNINYGQTLKTIQNFIISKKPHQICTVNPEYLMESINDAELKHILNKSDLNVADGGGLWFAAKYTRQKLTYKVTGVDLIWQIANLAAKNKYKIFFLGGKNNVGLKTAEILKKRFPKLIVAGVLEGSPIIRPISKKIYKSNYQSYKVLDMHKKSINSSNELIINAITKSKPDILLVAYGCPKQDKFIARYAKKLNIPVMIGVGGSFDYISGKIPRAPKWMRQIHLEWLYRVFKEPKRLNRIITATVRFPLTIIKKQNG